MTPFCPQHVKDLAGEVSEAPDWRIHGLLPRVTLALLAAYPKVGKSTFAGQLAVAVAQGRDFLGRRTSLGGVLYVVAEEQKDDVIRRLRLFGMNDESDPIYLWVQGVEDTEKDRQDLQDFIRVRNIALVVIDTFASYLLVNDETNNSEITRRLKPYLDMAHSNATAIVFVHHERKNRDESGDDSKAIRGGGAILGMVDLAFQLQQVAGGGTGRHLKITGRYSRFTPQSLKLDYRDDAYVSLGTPEEHKSANRRDQVLAVLPIVGAGLTAMEVAEKTGLGKKAAWAALEDAYAAKTADRSGAGKRGDAYRYVRVDVCSQELVEADKELAEV